MKHLISFTALLIWTISIGQKEISYVKTTVCNSQLNGKPSGEITSEHYKGNGGNEEQFKMNGFINGKLNSSSFYWYSPDGDYGLDYNFSNEEEECVTTFNYSVLLRSEVLALFQYEIFDGALDPESSVRFIYFSDTLEYDREFKITPSLVNQSEQFIHNHIYDDTPFDFKFPEFDFSSVELLQHSFNRKTKSLENGHTISYEVDSTLVKDGFRLRRDTSYHWKELDGKTTLYCTKSGNTIRKWAGKIYEKTHYERILLSSNSEDTINILKIKRGKSNLNQPFQTIEMEYFNGKNIDIQKRRIYLKYCKFGTPIYKKAEAQTFDGQEVVEVWRHRYISEKKITRDTVIDSEGTAHRIDLFPADLRSAGAWFPRRFKKSLRRNEDAFTYLNKKFLKEFDLNSKSKEKRTYVKSNQYEAKIIEIFYD